MTGCTEYEEVLEPLNVRLTHACLTLYRGAGSTRWELTITYTITTRVMAKDEEEAEEKAIEGSSPRMFSTPPDDITAGTAGSVMRAYGLVRPCPGCPVPDGCAAVPATREGDPDRD